MHVTHVIYDLDGLLLDTERFYTEATQDIARRYGKTFDWSVKSLVIGKRALDSATILTQSLDLPITPAEYLSERNEVLNRLLLQAEPQPGAVQLTEHLHRHRIPQAVASSSDRRTFEIKTARHRNWFSLFHCVVLGDDPAVVHGKPAPDIFLVAATRLNAAPEHCLVFEDAPSGVQAALAAGMRVIAVPDPNLDRRAYAGADQVLNRLTEFDPSALGLPPLNS
jgi:HAD superfamily hydrolase (TIGR01509 family)